MAQTAAQKSIFITGAGSGIGRASAQLFAERGWFVGLYDIDLDRARETAERIGAANSCTGLLDVADPAAWERSVAQFAEHTHGRMTVLLNNAGIGRDGWLEDISASDASRIIDVNLKGVLFGVGSALPALRATPGARIVNIASAAGLFGVPKAALYSATKAAVINVSEALDLEFERHAIRVTCVLPWVVETPLLAKSGESIDPTLSRKLAQSKAYPVRYAAEVVWRAAHDKPAVYFVGREARRARIASRILPGMIRWSLRRMLRQPG